MKTKLILAILLGILNIALFAAETKQAQPPGWQDRIGFDTIAIARTADLDRLDYSAGLRLSYDLTSRLGLVLEAESAHPFGKGTLVDSTFGGIKFAFPLKSVRPYLIGGAGWKTPTLEEYVAGGGGIEIGKGAFRVFAEMMAEKGTKRETELRLTSGVGFRF